MIRKAYRGRLAVTEEIAEFICNKCGRSVLKNKDTTFLTDEEQEFHTISISGSYSSKYPYDLTMITFDICADCLKALVESFVVPVEEVNHIGHNEFTVKHSETGEPITVVGHRAFHGSVDHDADIPEESRHAGKYPVDGSLWEHYKGKHYEVTGHAWDMTTNEWLVIYRALYGESLVFARPLSRWMEEIKTSEYTGTRFTFLDVPDV